MSWLDTVRLWIGSDSDDLSRVNRVVKSTLEKVEASEREKWSSWSRMKVGSGKLTFPLPLHQWRTQNQEGAEGQSLSDWASLSEWKARSREVYPELAKLRPIAQLPLSEEHFRSLKEALHASTEYRMHLTIQKWSLKHANREWVAAGRPADRERWTVNQLDRFRPRDHESTVQAHDKICRRLENGGHVTVDSDDPPLYADAVGLPTPVSQAAPQNQHNLTTALSDQSNDEHQPPPSYEEAVAATASRSDISHTNGEITPSVALSTIGLQNTRQHSVSTPVSATASDHSPALRTSNNRTTPTPTHGR